MLMGAENNEKNSTFEPGQKVKLRVGTAIKQRRIDKYLQGRFSNLSRAMIQRAIKAGQVKVNDTAVKPSQKINPGDIVQLRVPETPSREIEPEDIPLSVIHEDDDLIIINKQPGIIVHPARGNLSGTLVNALVHYSANLSTGLGEFRPGIVHRLDRNTSGVMIVTKNDTAQWKVAKQFEHRTTKKTYLAIVHGTPELSADRISAPLGIHPKIREKYAIRPDIGKEAITTYHVLQAFRGFSYMQLSPHTGRTHQLRVHMNYIRHPIVADDMYGGKLVYPWQLKDLPQQTEEPIIKRTALHAHSIEFRHPATDEMVTYQAPLPGDMQNLLDMLNRYRRK